MSVQSITVSSEHANRRLDNLLFTVFPNIPKSLIYRLIRKKAIRINNKKVSPKTRIKEGDIITFPLLKQEDDSQPRIPSKALCTLLQQSVLYEDEAFLVVNKPAGLAVHAGSGVDIGLIEALRQMRAKKNEYLELVHRLDRDTSGCLIIAKKPSVLRAFHELFRKNQITKIYIALTLGHFEKEKTIVASALVKNVSCSGERMVKISDEGKGAVSEFSVLKRFISCELVEVIIHTGRTHQIRVHAKSKGHPIAGDRKYGDKAFNKTMRNFGLTRLFLHAESIEFISPVDHRKIQINAPLDENLKEALETLYDFKTNSRSFAVSC